MPETHPSEREQRKPSKQKRGDEFRLSFLDFEHIDDQLLEERECCDPGEWEYQ